MIDTNKVSFNFIKKEPFTGSDSGMRYRLEKHSEEKEDYQNRTSCVSISFDEYKLKLKEKTLLN